MHVPDYSPVRFNKVCLTILAQLDKIVRFAPHLTDVSLNQDLYNALLEALPSKDRELYKNYIPYNGVKIIPIKKGK